MIQKIKMLALCVLILLPMALTAQDKGKAYDYKYFVNDDGEVTKMYRYAGYPPEQLPPVNTDPVPKKAAPGEKGVFYLDNVPSYTWCYGCTATASGIIAAYYDSYGAPTTYTGPENGGVAPMTNTSWNSQASQSGTDMCPLAASKMGVDGRATRGHGDDYWTGYGDEATDPYYGSWTEHDHYAGQPNTADFMGTNQWYNWENSDGSTSIWASEYGVYDYTGSEGDTPPARDGIHGLRLFYESLGFSVDLNFTKTILGYDDPDDNPDMGPTTSGYLFSDYKRSVDQGRPVIIQIEGHSMVGFGYDDTNTPETLYLRDTWDTQTSPTAHSMIWGSDYSNMTHYAISEVVLGTECYFAVPENVFAMNNNQVVTVSWDDPSKGTRNMSYEIYRDDFVTPIATGVTGTQYIDTEASDGVHYYAIKAYYIDDSYTSFMSDVVSVYVSISVENFYDDFESGDSQWLFKSGAYSQSWGIETQYAHEGTSSLTDTPGTGNYIDQMYDGIFAEVAPGINFTNHADANCTYWIMYDLENGFDYLYFQSSTDGLTWETLETYNGYGVGWFEETISLGLYAENPNVRFRFMLYSDDATNGGGSNIDEFRIQGTSVDGAAPYVWYTREKDFYTLQTDGFEISCDVTDFTGVDYANILYKVNGGTEQTLNPASVSGDTYSYKFPQFTTGDMIEYSFDVADTYAPSNTGTKGPYYYVEGKHHKYDSGNANGIVGASTLTDQYEIKTMASRFNTFYDDLKGVVIRGYRDERPEYDSDNMLITVWADNAGLPGAALITPVADFPNPATLTETYKWGYCDLSSYGALVDLVGDFWIGFECGTAYTGSGITLLTITDTGEAQEFYYGNTYYQYYASNGADLTWVEATGWNYHLRAVTTDEQIEPGILDPSPTIMSNELAPDATDSSTLNVGNSGGFDLNYNAEIEYLAKKDAKGVIAENNFNTGLGWTSSGDRTWGVSSSYDGGNLDGSQMAYVAAATTGPASTRHAYLTSGQIDMSMATSATFAFDHKKSASTSTVTVEASTDGAVWDPIYTETAAVGAWSNPDQQNITIPSQYFTATTQFRFHATLPKSSGYWAIDNVVVDAVTVPPWLTIDSGQTTSGFVAVSGTDPISVGWDATGLSEGVYNARINLTSENDAKNVIVQLTVTNMNPPGSVTLAYPSDAQTLSDQTPDFDWDVEPDATNYDILVDNNSDFSSPEINQTVSVSNYTPAVGLADGTYYWKVLGSNAGGDGPYSSTWTFTIATPNITVSESAVAGAGDLTGTLTDTDSFNIGNTGNAGLDYSISWDYVVAKSNVVLQSNNFDSGIGWTPSGGITWTQTTDANNLDGTPYAALNADPAADPNGTLIGTLTTGVFDGAAYYSIVVDFDQYAELATSLCQVDYTINGTDWTNIYNNNATIGAWAAPDHQKIEIPEKSTTMQVRFVGSMKNQSGSSWNLDNVVVTGLDPANYGWLNVYDTAMGTSGTVAVSGSEAITVDYDATGMDAGTYNAVITINSTDPDTPSETVDVQFVVSGGTVIPAVPAPVSTTVAAGNITFDWPDMADAESYNVFSSDDPYGTFTYVTNVTVSEYTIAVSQAKMFYTFSSVNSTKVEAVNKKSVKDHLKKTEESGN